MLIITIKLRRFRIKLEWNCLQPITIPKSRLLKYFEISELPEELGGTLAYNHEQWLCNRVVSIICCMFYFNVCMNVSTNICYIQQACMPRNISFATYVRTRWTLFAKWFVKLKSYTNLKRVKELMEWYTQEPRLYFSYY